jgi:hypothetical protein
VRKRASAAQPREQSSISFPYCSLADAMIFIEAIRNHGDGVARDELAAATSQKRNSWPFLNKAASSQIFGLIRVEKQRFSLTNLGRKITDPQTQVSARVKAFLSVPLYRKICLEYEGQELPNDRVLEEKMVSIGVPHKQQSRARQHFQRDAEQAGLFNERKTRLILPKGISIESIKSADLSVHGQGKSLATEIPLGQTNIPSALLPLFDSLPPVGAEWPSAARQQWMRILDRSFDRLYKEP